MMDLKDDLRQMDATPAAYSPVSKKESPPPPAALRRTPALQHELSESRDARPMDLNEHSNLTGEDVYLGGGSIPALIKSLATNGNRLHLQEVFGDNMLPLFGLDNESATYPFISLWGYQGTPVRINELRKLIPTEAECLE